MLLPNRNRNTTGHLSYYTICTADKTVRKNPFIGTFADDTAIMATDKSQPAAVKKLKKTLDKINQWTIDLKIKLNETKSSHVTFALHLSKWNSCATSRVSKISHTKHHVEQN